MNGSVPEITLPELALAFLPVALVLFILYRWSLGTGRASYALARMLIQLGLIGYVLTFLFDTDQGWIVVVALTVMLAAASWIALSPIRARDARLYGRALTAIAIGSIPVLGLVTQVVLGADPWYEPRYLVPLAGMIFANAMNTVSLAAERHMAETEAGTPGPEARRRSLQAALIPTVNSLFAVGLVSLPGMMTGQILSGVSPLIAARYQIVVMCMLFSASGIAAACYLLLTGRGET